MSAMPTHEPIHELVSRSAERFANLPAVACGSREVTYGALERRANTLAAALAGAGAQPGDPVAILCQTSAEVIAAMLAALKAGCAFVPLDPGAAATRVEDAVAAVRPRHWLVSAACARQARALQGEQGPAASPIVVDGADDIDGLDGGGEPPPRVAVGPDAFCYVYFTSGSTGCPKAIAGRLRAIDHFVRWEVEALGLGPGVRVSQLTSPAFDAFLRDAFVPLAVGGTVCPPPSREVLLDGGRLVDWIDESALDLVHCTPSVFRLVLAQPLSANHFPRLRHVLLAGEALLPVDVRRWRSLFGNRIELINLYGPSETTMVKLFHRVTAEDAAAAIVPIGKPMPGAEAAVLDERRRPCPPGKLGEIYIRTPYRTLGYLGRPDLTQEVFVQNPASDQPGDIVYRTGDLGRLRDDGSLEIIGRRDQQVKVRGVRIEIAPIEELLRSHAAVTDAAVVDREDTQGNKYLCAYLVLREPLAAGEPAAYLRARLTEAMVPSAFVVLEALPRTLSGKIDRRALPAPSRPASVAGSGTSEPAPPRSPLEARLCALFQELLSLPKVGIFDDFFALGGHSLLAGQLLARTRREFGSEVSLRAFFDAPTVAGMAAALTESRIARTDPQELVRLVAALEGVSEDEARRRLAEGPAS